MVLSCEAAQCIKACQAFPWGRESRGAGAPVAPTEEGQAQGSSLSEGTLSQCGGQGARARLTPRLKRTRRWRSQWKTHFCEYYDWVLQRMIKSVVYVKNCTHITTSLSLNCFINSGSSVTMQFLKYISLLQSIILCSEKVFMPLWDLSRKCTEIQRDSKWRFSCSRSVTQYVSEPWQTQCPYLQELARQWRKWTHTRTSGHLQGRRWK